MAFILNTKTTDHLNIGRYITNSNDHTQAFIDARIDSIAKGYKDIFLPTGNYIISSEVKLDNSAGFLGASFKGENSKGVNILFAPASSTAKCFSMNGGSGDSSNKALRNMTIKPYDASYNNLGIGLFIDGQDFAVVEDVNILTLNYGFDITNTSPGNFSEFNRFSRCRLNACQKGIAFERNGGNDSFHGNSFHDVQINIPANGYGIYSNGISGSNYIYNCYFRVNLFGGTGTRYGIYVSNTNSDNNESVITGEGAMTLKAETDSIFRSFGHFNTISALTYDAEPGRFIFDNDRSKSTFVSVNMPTASPRMMGRNIQHGYNGDFPGMMHVYGSNIESLAFTTYNFAGNAFYFGQTALNGKLEDFSPKWKLLSDGTKLTSFATSIQFMDSAQTANQLLLSNGRTGGRIGRDLTFAVTANAGVPQDISTITNADSSKASVLLMRITGASLEYRVLLAINHNGFGNPGYVLTLGTFVSTLPGGVTINTITMNSSGVLVVNITTSINCSIICAEKGLGYQLTS